MSESDGSRKATLRARREAQPLPWGELTEEQQAAARQACGILGDIAKQAGVPAAEHSRLQAFLPAIDGERLNHVVLLDGGRGVGKTALLVTLLDGWSRSLRGEPPRRRGSDDTSPTPPELLALTRDVVPVGMIDLQPLPPGTNLMMHLVGQFLPLIEALEEGDRDHGRSQRARQRAPWSDLEPSEPASVGAWRDFLRAAAAGWGGSLAGRRAQLDPEAYALELEQTERNRLDVRRCFRALMDRVAEEMPQLVNWSADRKPLFVIPVDDADMNPERVVELLELLRTLWHPRVAFLLTGHSKLFMAMLRARALAGMRTPLNQTRAFVPADIESLAEMTSAELANSIYEKVIPVAHRCALRSLSPRQRFQKLAPLLRRVPAFPHSLGLASLEDYFALQPQVQELLPSTMREIADLESFLEQGGAPAVEGDAPVGSGLSTSVQGTPRQGMSLGGFFRRLPGMKEATEAALEGSSAHTPDLEVLPRSLSWWVFGGKRMNRGPGQPTAQLWYNGAAPTFCIGEDTRSIPMNGASASELVLWDVHSEGSVGRIGLMPFAVWAEVNPNLYGFDGNPLPPRLPIAWPLPDWLNPLDYAVFHRLYRGVLQSKSQNRMPGDALAPDLGWAARMFLAATMAIAELRHDRDEQARERGSFTPLHLDVDRVAARIVQEAPGWSELARKVRDLAGDPSVEAKDAFALWARARAGLLAAPESLLAPQEANAWLLALKASFGEGWERVSSRLRLERASRVEIVLSWGVMSKDDAVASPMFVPPDARLDAYLWFVEVQERDKIVAEFVTRLDDVEVVSPVEGTTLRRYLGGQGQNELALTAPIALVRTWTERLRLWSGTSGIAPSLLNAVWSDAVKQGFAPELEALSGASDFRALERYYLSLGGVPWRQEVGARHETIASSILVAPVHWAWRPDIWSDHPAAARLFELIWDVLSDLDEKYIMSNAADYKAKVAWWEGVAGTRDLGERVPSLYPWPFVDWPAFFDDRLFEEHWNGVIPKIRGAADLAPSNASIADDLAYWYIRVVLDLYQRPRESRPWRGDLSGMEVAEKVVEATNFKPYTAGRRALAVMAWAQAVPLLAAPESGLTPGAAEAILSRLKLDDKRRFELLKLRRDRVRHRKIEGLGIEESLREIDKAVPEHPWVVQIEKHK